MTASNELKALESWAGCFTSPKPTPLIRRELELFSGINDGDVITGFFRRIGNNGPAVMAQNAADGGNRRFVLVQLPEAISADNKDQKVAANLR